MTGPYPDVFPTSLRRLSLRRNWRVSVLFTFRRRWTSMRGSIAWQVCAQLFVIQIESRGDPVQRSSVHIASLFLSGSQATDFILSGEPEGEQDAGVLPRG